MRPGLVLAQVMIVLSAIPVTFAGQRPLSPSGRTRLQQLGDRFLRQREADRLQLLNQVSMAELAPRLITSTARVVQLQRLVGSRPIYYITDNLDAAYTVGANRVWPGGELGLALTGAGVTVALWDGGGALASHQEFGGRLTRRDATLPTSDHATHIAGTIAAAGIVTDATGMAGGVELDSYDWNDDTAEMAAAASAGLVLSNHSFSLVAGWERDFFGDDLWAWHGDPAISGDEDWVFGFYLQVAADWDELAAAAPDYLMVTSAGNDRGDNGPGPGPAEHWVFTGGEWVKVIGERDPDGDYDSLPGGASCAKNVLVVGAVGDIVGGYEQTADVVMSAISSWGPTDDGRIKPDLVANGIVLYSTDASHNMAYDTLGGTSTAAAVVTGSLALLQEHYRASHDGAWPRSATMRALVVHSADEAGNAAGPDYSFGWGLLNTAAAAELISLDTVDDHHVQELVLSDGGTVTLMVTSDGTAPLKVTVAWTDPPGTVPATALDPTDPRLVNDLDLTLTSLVTQQLSNPWVLDQTNPELPATTGNNYRDNIEQVWEPGPIAGEYQITIDHKGVLANGPQQFSLVVTGAEFPPRPKVLVWEGDSTVADYSGRFIREALSLGDSIDVDYRLVLPTDLSVYDAAFLSFGNYGGGPGKTPFTAEQADVVQAYLEDHGRLYLEGGDALGVAGSDQGGNDILYSLLGLASVADGYDYPVADLVGQPGSLGEGIVFTSSSQISSQYIDRYTTGDGWAAFIESDYGTVAVQHAGENGSRSFVFSYALAGLVDGSPPATKSELLHRIYNFLMEEVPTPALTGISPNALWRGRRTLVQLTGENLDIVTSITVNQPAVVENPPEISVLGDQMSVYMTIMEEANGDSVKVSAHALTGSGSIAVRLDSAPETVDDTVEVWEDSTTVLALLRNDRHPPADSLHIATFSLPQHGIVLSQPGDTTVSYSPAADYFGPDSFTYTAVDTGGEVSQAGVWLTILPVNDAPVLISPQADTAYQAERYVYRAEASDVENDPLLFSFSSQITWLASAGGDSVAGTPGAADSGGNLKVKVTDGAAWDSITVVIAVLPPNYPPVAINDAVTTPEDTMVVVAVISNDYDPDGDRPFISAVTPGQHGEVARQPGDTTLMYTPEADFNGLDQFVYTISDAGGLTATAAVIVTVTPVNDAPEITSPAEVSVIQHEPFTYRATAEDVDGDSLAVYVSWQLSWMTAIDSSLVVGTPQLGDSGGVMLVTAWDGQVYDSLDVTVVVVMVNHRPEAVDDTVTTLEDSVTIIPVLANDYDPDGEPLEVILFGAGRNGSEVTAAGDTALMYTPEADFNGLDQFVYTISDAGGLTATAAVIVTVTPVNDAPEITSPAEVSVIQHEPFTYQATAGDVDGDSLSVAVYRLLAWMTTVDSSLVVGMPQLGDSGGVMLVTAWDGQVYDSLEVTIAVVMVNHRPEAVNDTVTMFEDSVTIIPVLANDHDPDGEPLEIIIIGAGRNGGEVTAAGDTALAFSPLTNYFGPDTFAYAVRDSAGVADSALVLVTILPVNDPPGPFRLLSPATGMRIGLRSGLLDDSLVFTWESTLDVEGDPVTYSFQATPALAGVVDIWSGDDTSFSQLYGDLADALLATAERRLTGSWTVWASDGAASTEAIDGPFVITLDATVLTLEPEAPLPGAYALGQNYPNPFNPATIIPFALPEETAISMTIHDLWGREMRRLVDARLPAGYHRVVWNGHDVTGRPLPSGIYLAVMKAPDFRAQRKVVLLR